jgi:hypothetical protein
MVVRPLSNEERKRLRQVSKPTEFKKGHIGYWKGKHRSSEYKRRMSEQMKGSLNPNWKGGISPEMIAFLVSPEWKEARHLVWKRDKSTCQLCREVYIFGYQRFEVHHIVPYSPSVEINLDLDNLILLCKDCHGLVGSSTFVERFGLTGIM